MTSQVGTLPLSPGEQARTAARFSPSYYPLAMLVSRTILFAAFQALIAIVFVVLGNPAPWEASMAWWPATATLTNLVCLWLLSQLLHREGLGLIDLYRIDGRFWKGDLLVLLGFMVIAGPVGFLPNGMTATLLWGSTQPSADLFFRPLPLPVIYASLVLFPITNGLTELTLYFGYVMPRLRKLWNNTWLAIIVTSFFLAAQHMTLPLIFDSRYLTWRLVMFMPFALFVGIVLAWRPRLLPYMLLVHALMDLSLVAMLLMFFG